MQRRHFIKQAVGAGLAGSLLGCAGRQPATVYHPPLSPIELPLSLPPLEKVEARSDRIVAMNVCTRPFRAMGPRTDVEVMGNKTVIHNYGHGGSGWSLSWGAAALAEKQIQAETNTPVAVVGCGAIGLTTAIACQRAGYQVTIYAKERPPYVRSSYATGIWSPDSRIVTLEHASGYAQTWQWMARLSYLRFQTLLGLPGHPVEWTTMFRMADKPFSEKGGHNIPGEPPYPAYQHELLNDLTPKARNVPTELNPFATPYVRQFPLLMFNISAYSQYLLDVFTRNGGVIVHRELRQQDDFKHFDEPVIVNCTGYGAKTLLNDDTITPVRGQTCKLIPQPGLQYGIQYFDKHTSFYPRRDGILVQAGAEGDFNNPQANIDPAESIAAVNAIADIMQSMRSV
ncbi:FAD-binding oxidoreductase [Aestuariibacter sp. GS-14]|uniref:FAD-dependent oxidoreductase n=1 Tax=Aestuariibacter sp. GS-14 TaxID=2590670 RepID=UPI00112EE933|nr:FAD-dependent oxidoreductase [Aestuariibacter sp. GS-14]TPV56905.1 FAD-binding oxidoreductase [Aestuariibacter sp. GS-14]